MPEIRMVAGADLIESGLFHKISKLEGCNCVLPNPLLSVGWIGHDQGRIYAHGILHSLPVIEFVHADNGHGYLIGEIVKQVEEFVLKSGAPRVLAHSDHRAMLRIMSRIGFDKAVEPWMEWRRDNVRR